MKTKKDFFYKYYLNDEQSNEYPDFQPINKKEYKRKIQNVKSRYMGDYKKNNKGSKYMEDKYFNNLMKSYLEDYNKLKNKYKFKDDEDQKNTNIEIDEKDYDLKKQDIKQIFSGDLLDIQDFNFDVCDKLINDLSKEDNNTLLKSTQNKEDYEFRLQGLKRNKNNEKLKEENEEEDMVNIKGKESGNLIMNKNDINNNEIKNDKNVINDNIGDNNIKNDNMNNNNSKDEKNNNDVKDNKDQESDEYLKNDGQFKEDDNYQNLSQQKLDEELPLLYEILTYDYNKNSKVPLNEHEKDETLKKSEEHYSDLINENKEKDKISNDFVKDEKIPENKFINSIKVEKENEQKDVQEQNINIEEKKSNDNKNLDNDNNNLINNKIKESGAFIEVEEENVKKEEEKNEIEPKNEEENKDDNDNNKGNEKINIDENNDFNKEQTDKIDVDDLKELEDLDGDKKYNDFSA